MKVTKPSKLIQTLNRFEVDPNDFEVLEKSQNMGHIAYLHRSLKWWEVESRLLSNDKMMKLYLDYLARSGKGKKKEKNMNIGFSINQRHKLQHRKFMPTTTGNQFNFIYMDNKLLLKDVFQPTEEMIGEKPIGTFLNMRDFNFTEQDVHVIASTKSKLYERFFADAHAGGIIGVDFEFQDSSLGLMQFSTRNAHFLFDPVNCPNKNKLATDLLALLSDESVKKVFFAGQGDLDMFEKTFTLLEPVVRHSTSVYSRWRRGCTTSSRS